MQLLKSINTTLTNFKNYFFNGNSSIDDIAPVITSNSHIGELQPEIKKVEPIESTGYIGYTGTTGYTGYTDASSTYIKPKTPKTEEQELREYVLALFEKYKNIKPSWPKKYQPFLTIRDILRESFSVELTNNEARKILFRTLLDIPHSKLREYFFEGCKIYEEFLLEKDITKTINISKILEQAKNRNEQISDIGYLKAIDSVAINKIKNYQKAKNVYCAMYEYKKAKNLKDEFHISLQDIKYWLQSKNIRTCEETISKLIRCLHDNGLIDKVLPRKYRPPEEGYCIPAMYRFSDRWEQFNTDNFKDIKYPIDSLKKYNDKKKKDEQIDLFIKFTTDYFKNTVIIKISDFYQHCELPKAKAKGFSSYA